MMHSVRLSLLFSLMGTKRVFEQPLSILFFLCGKIARFILFFLFVYYLLTRTKVLAGYTLPETLLFFCTFSLIDTLVQFLFRSVYTFKPLVATGNFDTILTKPYHPFVAVLFGGLDPLDALLIIPYGILTVLLMTWIPGLTIQSVFAYCLLIFLALIIAMGIHIIILAVGLITVDIDNTVMMYRDVTRLGSFPLAIYAKPIQSVLLFLLPVGIMMSIPVQVLIGERSSWWMVASIACAGGILFTGMKLWQYSLRRYQSWGG